MTKGTLSGAEGVNGAPPLTESESPGQEGLCSEPRADYRECCGLSD